MAANLPRFVRVDLTSTGVGRGISLDVIEVPESECRKGFGDKALELVIKLSDELGISLEVTPQPLAGYRFPHQITPLGAVDYPRRVRERPRDLGCSRWTRTRDSCPERSLRTARWLLNN
jgi:hypothetical protein